MERKEINVEHVINSLANRLTEANVELANKDAVIIDMSEQIAELKKDNDNLKDQLKGNAKNKDNKNN